MRLADVFPRAEIAAAVPGAVFRDLDVQKLESFTAENPNTMIAFGFATWDHALSSGCHDDLDPQMLAGPINDEDPGSFGTSKRRLVSGRFSIFTMPRRGRLARRSRSPR